MLDALTKNLLIRRDTRRLRRTWYRRPWIWALAAVGVIQLAFCWKMEAILGRPVDQGYNEGLLFYYFIGFHVFLQILLPLAAIFLTHRPGLRHRVEEYLVTTIPARHIFWHLWLRVALPGLTLVLILYFPLWMRFPWLYEVEPEHIVSDRPDVLFELVNDALILGLIFSIWLRSKLLRRLIWICASLFLFILPIALILIDPKFKVYVFAFFPTDFSVDFEELCVTSYARWHPLITLSYFITSTAWSTGVGVALVLRSSGGPGRAIWRAILLIPLPEWGILHILVFDEWVSLYGSLWFLVAMLQFYMFGIGAFWMALKWRLLMSLSRWAVRTE